MKSERCLLETEHIGHNEKRKLKEFNTHRTYKVRKLGKQWE